MAARTAQPVEIFVCYAHEDLATKKQLLKHLKGMERRKLVSAWHDGRIEPGKAWGDEIKQALERCSIGLLLVSPDFLDSEFIHSVEQKRLLERHRLWLDQKVSGARVVAIIVQDCAWQNEDIARFEVLPGLPHKGKPLASFAKAERNTVLATLARQIEEWATGLAGEPAQVPTDERRSPPPRPAPQIPTAARRWWLAALGTALLLVVAGLSGWSYVSSRTHIRLADSYLERGHWQDAKREYEAARGSLLSKGVAESGLQKVALFENSASYSGAADFPVRLEALLSQMPGDPHLLLFKGQLALNALKLTDAHDAFTQVTKLRPDFSAAWDGLGEGFDSEDKPREARDAYARAAKLAPEEPRYRVNLAAAELRLHKPQPALDVLDNVIAAEVDYWFPRVLEIKARLLLEDGPGARQSAEALARRIREADDKEIDRNASPWSFRVPDGWVRLDKLQDKRYYVSLLAAAASTLDGDAQAAEAWLGEADKHPPAEPEHIRALTLSDLDAAQCVHPELKGSVDLILARLLKLRQRPWPAEAVCAKAATTAWIEVHPRRSTGRLTDLRRAAS